jgi:hypothetical protein
VPPKRRASDAPKRYLRGGACSLVPHASVGVTRAHTEPIAARRDPPFDTFIRGAQRLPLPLRESEEGEQFVAAFVQARHHARAPLGPRALEGNVGDAGCIDIGRVHDAVEVVADLGQRMFRRFPLEVAELVHTAALRRRPRPDLADGATHRGDRGAAVRCNMIEPGCVRTEVSATTLSNVWRAC